MQMNKKTLKEKKKAKKANALMQLKEMIDAIGELAEMVEKKIDAFEKRLEEVESHFSGKVDLDNTNKKHKQ
jgi:hypothetical protein